MPGEERDGVVDFAMGDGNAGIGKTANAGRDARHDTERHAVFDERQRLFTTPSEDEGVAALEPKDTVPGLGEFHETQRNVALLGRRLAATFAGIFKHGTIARELEAILVDQGVMYDDVGFRQSLRCKQRQQARISGAGTGQPHMARLDGRQARGQGKTRRFTHAHGLGPVDKNCNSAPTLSAPNLPPKAFRPAAGSPISKP